MKALFTPITKYTVCETMDFRDMLNKVMYVLVLSTYIAMFTLTMSHLPQPAFIAGLILSPLATAGIFIRTTLYLYIRNYYYLIVSLIKFATFFYVLYLLTEHADVTYETPVAYEAATVIITNFLGVAVSVILSFPAKIVHEHLFDPKEFYFSMDIFDGIEKLRYPEKETEEKKNDSQIQSTKVKESKKKDAFKFDVMNETQLQVEFQNALNEERYEDAEAIKKILSTKFK